MRTPNVVTVNIKELNRKTVDIRCDLVGNLADGYNAGELILSQTSVELQGQAEDVNSISYAKVTLDIGNQAEESITQELELQYYDANHQLVTNTNIRSLVETVQVTLPVFVTKELPLVVEFKEAAGLKASNLEYEISPATIVVSGDASKLKGVKNIVLGEFDLADMLNNNASSHTYPIIIPEGCQNLSGVTRATLEVKFKDMKIARVPTSTFQYENMPINKKVTVLSEDLTVRIFGKAADVDAVTGENISVIANLSDYSGASGTYTVPVSIDVVADGDIGVSGTYEIKINIAEEAEEENPSQAQQE
jgi:YbbR domain-containing protein